MIDLKVFKTFFAFFITFCFESILFVNSSNILRHDYNKIDSDLNDYYFDDPDFRDINDSDNNIRVIYSTHYDIFVTQLNDNFTQELDTKGLRSHLSDPTEVYYNLYGNYFIYEMIGSLYAYPLNVSKVNTLGLTGEHPLPNSVKANSQLNIDWIHELLFWVKDKKQILVTDIRQMSKIVVLANKLYDYIMCLAVNPIESFVLWIEFDIEYNEYIVYKSFGDGSNRHQFLVFTSHIKSIEFDYQAKRIYYLSTFELSSTTYEGADSRTLVSESHSIFQFEVLQNHIYWIEYNSNQFFRSDLNDIKNSQKVIQLNQTINRFKVINFLRQPLGLNRCRNSSCSDICLPIDFEYYRCVCQKTCSDNQDIQLVFNERRLGRLSSTTSTTTTTTSTTTTTTTQRPMTTTTVMTNIKDNTTTDKINYDPIDSLSFADRNRLSVEVDDPVVNMITQNDLDYLNNFKSTNESSKQTTIQPLITTQSTTTESLSVRNDTKLEEKEESDKNLYGVGTERQIGFENRDKYLTESTNTTEKFESILTNTSNEIMFTEKNVSDIHPINVLVDEIKEYEYNLIPKVLYNPLIYGLILLITGLFIGTILSAIAIRINGKHNCRNTYSTNTGATNKWDSVGFKKAEHNIYFGAKYTVKDESLY